LLGLTTAYIPNWESPQHIAELEFISAVTAAKVWVKYLREVEKVDIIVVSYHGGFERDIDSGLPIERLTGENEGYQLCMEVDGIDVLLTGHQHREIATELGGVTVIQPSNQGRFLGKATLKLEQREGGWTLSSKTAELLSIEDVETDLELISKVQEYEQNMQKWLDLPIGQLEGDMRIKDPMLTRIRDNALIEFINKVQMECTGALISNTALFDNESTGFGREITMRDIVSNYIYPNTLKVIRITGQDIKDALELSASYFAPYDGVGFKISQSFTFPKPQHYNYDMWEGITYRINVSRPLGSRVTMLNYQDKPIELQDEFDVAMNNYRAGGGGNYSMFQNKFVVRDIPIDMSELLTNYIMGKGTIVATVNQNWEVVF
jgi:2',3'-cyclic-nucleotide 2'-phosphodiesterase/3'-nucleotidase